MAINSLTGSDTIIINDRVLTDFGNGDIATLTYSNESVAVTTGKSINSVGNSIFAFNETSRQADVELRVLKSSSDDKFLNSIKTGMDRDFAAFSLLVGQFVKRIGDGQGNVSNEIYNLSGGAFSQSIDSKSNVEGDTDQAIAIYKIKFSNAPRSIT